jgi:hypothetical protein
MYWRRPTYERIMVRMLPGGMDRLNWSGLRATRATPPPAAAAQPARRSTYVFALEQAEQMFRAAQTVDAAVRPLLVFYDLSQAGRAIAAAASSVSGDDWRLIGHGIKSSGLDGSIEDIVVLAEGTKGSFVRLSDILHSPTWDKTTPVRLTELWDALPENTTWPLHTTGTVPRRVALPFVFPESVQSHPMISTFLYLPESMLGSGDRAPALREIMSAYPQAAGYHWVGLAVEDGEPALHPAGDGWVRATITFWVNTDRRTATAAEHRARFDKIASRHADEYHLVPAVGPNPGPMHPLMTWWAITFTLSMLARYQPAEWGRHIDVDASPYAVAIEKLLSRALEELPSLIRHTIDEVV